MANDTDLTSLAPPDSLAAATAALEHLPDVAYALQLEPDARFLYLSPSVERYIGYTPAELYADRQIAWQLLDERDSGVHSVVDDAPVDSQIDFTARWRGRWGGIAWTEHRGVKVRLPDGSVVVYGVARDVTDRQEALDRLIERETEARDILDHASDVLVRYGVDGTVLWASPSLATVFGWDPQDVVGTKLRLGDTEASVQAYTEVSAAALSDRPSVSMRLPVVCADGSRRWSDVTTQFVRDADGFVQSAIALYHDVTAQVDAERARAESEEQYRLLAENASDIVFRARPDGVIDWVSPSVVDLLGLRPEEIIGRLGAGLLHPDDRARSAAAVTAVNNGERAAYEARFRRADGTYRWMQVTARPIRDEGGAVIGRVGSWRDVESQMEAVEALQLSERRFRLAMESAPTGMAIVDLDRRFIDVNPALCRMLDRDEDWLLAHRVVDIIDPEDDLLDLQMRTRLVAGDTASLSSEKRLLRADGATVWVDHALGLMRDEAGLPLYFVSQFANVTEARSAREALHFMATHDPLTQLVNRRELIDRMSRLLAHTPRTGTRLGILYLDLDGFKPVNDEFGHAIGDQLLIEVATRLAAQVRSDDYVGRMGGDEFVVVLRAIQTADDARGIARKLIDAVEVPFDIEGRSLRVSASVGIAVAEPGEDPDLVLRRADEALYAAKRSGRSTMRLYDRESMGDRSGG